MEKVINIEDVVDITKEGLFFSNGEGTVNMVSFEECRKNWVEHVNQGGFVDWKGNPVQLTMQESNCVGERNMTAKPPYLLLYGDEKVKIELKPSSNKELSKVQKELMRMMYEVGKVTTFDMS